MSATFKPGDKVTLTNDNGVVFTGKTIVKLDEGAALMSPELRYFITPTDTPWYSFPASQLSLATPRPEEM